MERKKYPAIMMVLFLAGATALFSQSTRRQIYEAYISGDMEKWRIVMLNFANTRPQSTLHKLELAGYYYGYTAWLMGNERKRQSPRYIAAAEEVLEDIFSDSTEDSTLLATANAYMGAFIGYKIGLQPLRAPFLGPKSMNHTERAFELDADNIQAHIDLGNSLFYRPRLFGGDKIQAVRHYEKAAALYEKMAHPQNDWNYLNLLVLLAQAYKDIDQLNNAAQVYDKILSIEPDFQWVRDELHPNLLRK